MTENYNSPKGTPKRAHSPGMRKHDDECSLLTHNTSEFMRENFALTEK